VKKIKRGDIRKMFQGLKKGGHHGCLLPRKKGVGTEGVKREYSRVDTRVNVDYGTYISHISKKNRGKLVTWYALKNSSQKFYHLEGVSRIRKGWAPWVFINTGKRAGHRRCEEGIRGLAQG
jgi:hypothetical protein